VKRDSHALIASRSLFAAICARPVTARFEPVLPSNSDGMTSVSRGEG
jgi:hypothetical protein